MFFMIEKKIDIYAEEFIRIDLNSVELICEAGDNYAILAVSDISGKKIIACEYFEFDTLNNNWNNIFNEIKVSSKILTNDYNSCRLFYNFPEVLVVPALYDNAENAKIYLNTFYGTLKNSTVEIDRLQAFDNVSVVYSVEEEHKLVVQNNLKPSSVHHSYSKLLQNISQVQNSNEKCLHLFFYNQMMVAVLINNSQLQFIKSVKYLSFDDVLYFILNIAKQYGVSTEQLQLKVSGFINPDSDEFMVLQKYFLHIVLEEPHETIFFSEIFKGFPKQYFTPFFYLLA